VDVNIVNNAQAEVQAECWLGGSIDVIIEQMDGHMAE
jgi:hypothetical protein